MKENSKKLREKASVEVRARKSKTLADKIKKQLIVSWGEWQYDYEGWVNWAKSLYTADATICINNKVNQNFYDYKERMKSRLEDFTIEIGPIIKMIVESSVAAFVYHMYLTSNRGDNIETYDIVINEFNTFEEVDGKLMVKHLDMYTNSIII